MKEDFVKKSKSQIKYHEKHIFIRDVYEMKFYDKENPFFNLEMKDQENVRAQTF